MKVQWYLLAQFITIHSCDNNSMQKCHAHVSFNFKTLTDCVSLLDLMVRSKVTVSLTQGFVYPDLDLC